MNALHAITVASAVSAGISSGITFAFSNFVMAGLSRLSPSESIRAMQQINETVLNPAFLTIFMGTGAAAVGLAAVDAWSHGQANLWLVVGAVIYTVGVVVVTVVGNVPLNEGLAAVDASAAPSAWAGFEAAWLRWNHVRWVAAAAAAVALSVGAGR